MLDGVSCQAEINLSKIKNNLGNIKSFVGKRTSVLCVVKANAYGHGLVEVARACEGGKADFLGVTRYEEGVTLRESGVKIPILVLGPTFEEAFHDSVLNNLTLSISTLSNATKLNRVCMENGLDAKVHLKVDTGLNRNGFLLKDFEKDLNEVLSLKNIVVSGCFTHFASSDSDDKFTISQALRFKKALVYFNGKVFGIIKHACNSYATYKFKEFHFDMVRVGRALYGLGFNFKTNLEETLSLKSRIALIRKVSKGETIGYGRTYKAPKNLRVALVTIGYGDGVPRLLSNKGYVLIEGKRANILGKISMDQMVVDVSNIVNAKVNDEVVIIGKSGKEAIRASDIADLSETIDYEILTGISERVKRVYV